MGLLEEEWSGAGTADMSEEEEGDGGHHPELQELLQEVKEEDDPVPVSSNELLNNFGPLEIKVLENGR